MARSLLLMLNQMPHDPASGAARNVRTQCEILAESGYRVRCVATTATEHGSPRSCEETLREAGCVPNPRSGPEGSRVFGFEHRGIHYTLLDVGQATPQGWEARQSGAFDRLVELELDGHTPEMLFTFGGRPNEVRRRAVVREAGAVVVLAILNHSYMNRDAFAHVDAVGTVSQYTRDLYHREIGLVSTTLPSPMEHEDVVAEAHEPRYLTFINPTVHKGLMFFVRLADEIAKAKSSLPIMVIESRGNAGHLFAAAKRGKIDLARHENILVSPGVAQPKHIYEATRVLLVPSVWEEPFGRVASEAVLNGIPPIVSDRGGLAEAAAGGGYVLPLPKSLTTDTLAPVSVRDVGAWKALAIRLMTDDPFYLAARERAGGRPRRYHLSTFEIGSWRSSLGSGGCPKGQAAPLNRSAEASMGGVEHEESKDAATSGVDGGEKTVRTRVRMRTRKKALLALVFGVLLAAVVIELCGQGYFIVMRRTGWHDIQTHDQHFFEKADSEVLGYRMRPGWSKEYRGRWLRINAHGIRDRFDEIPTNVLKVAILGDSVVFGNNLTQERTLSELVELNLDPTGINVQVLNFGVSGYCLEQVLEFFRQKDEIYDVDVVVLVLNPNDFCRIGTITEGGSNGLYRMYNPPLIKGPWLLKKLVYRHMRQPKAHPSTRWYRWVFRSNRGAWKSRLLELASVADDEGFELIVIPFPAGSAFENGQYGLEAERESIVSFLDDQGIERLDLLPQVAGKAEWFFDKTDHCTVEGNQLFADLITEQLVPIKRRWIEQSLSR